MHNRKSPPNAMPSWTSMGSWWTTDGWKAFVADDIGTGYRAPALWEAYLDQQEFLNSSIELPTIRG